MPKVVCGIEVDFYFLLLSKKKGSVAGINEINGVIESR